MDILSQKIEISALQEGDHIYTWRSPQLYSHHGIVVQEDIVIHFRNTYLVDGSSSIFSPLSAIISSLNTPCPTSYCGFEKVPGSGVQLSCIHCFIKKGSLYRFKYQASREFLLSKVRGGTCTTATSDPSKEVIARAIYLFENGYRKYHLLNNNCEDFALYCKTGLWSIDKYNQGRSSQANMVRRGDDELENKSGKFLHKLTNAFPRYCLKRMNNDLGNRHDVVKVDVTELSSFCCSLTYYNYL